LTNEGRAGILAKIFTGGVSRQYLHTLVWPPALSLEIPMNFRPHARLFNDFAGASAVFWREYLIFKRRFFKQIISWLVMPVLYLLAFHFALGDGDVQGRPYSDYLLVGLMAMNSMVQSWAIASDINISRFYWHTFDEILSAPVTPLAYVAGEVLAGMARAVMAVFLVLAAGLIGGISIDCLSMVFWAAMLLNALIFSSLAVGVAMRVREHADQAMLTNFIITPMAFLSGTFFPVDRLPELASRLINLLPLSHANRLMQAAAAGADMPGASFLVLAGWGILSFAWAVISLKKTTQ